MGLTTTHVFRWDDPGALKLDGTAGSFYAIIKTYLQAAGWSVAFDDPGDYKIAFRNSQAHGGSGGYLRVHDDASFTGAGRVASWQTYEDMTDIDTGTLQCCADWIWKARETGGAQGADAVRRCYVIVADERTCYVNTWVGDDNANPRGINPTPPDLTNGNLACLAWAGDIEAFVAGDPGFGGCGMTNQNPSASATGNGPPSSLAMGRNNVQLTSGSSTFFLSREADLSPTPRRVAIMTMGGLSEGYGPGANTASSIALGTPTYYHPALVIGNGVLRGRLRGIFIPMNDLTTTAMPMGATQTPIKDSHGLSLLTMRASCQAAASGTSAGYLFAEKNLSWDDI